MPTKGVHDTQIEPHHQDNTTTNGPQHKHRMNENNMQVRGGVDEMYLGAGEYHYIYFLSYLLTHM